MREGRNDNQTRKITIEGNYLNNPYGSCLVSYGETKVICTASVEKKIPSWLKESGKGWITAEYGMLPASTNFRMDREAVRGKQNSRTQEIQRLIGRSLRSVVDLTKISGLQIRLDCDVIHADGGTRTAAITGAYVALALAVNKLLKENLIKDTPLKEKIAAISVGIINQKLLVDLDYAEDSNAETDANFVMSEHGNIVEIQVTGEKAPFPKEALNQMIEISQQVIKEITKIQEDAITKYK